jgi:hypothetical protein
MNQTISQRVQIFSPLILATTSAQATVSSPDLVNHYEQRAQTFHPDRSSPNFSFTFAPAKVSGYAAEGSLFELSR